MPVLPRRVEVAPRTAPAEYGLLATVRPQAMPDHGAMGGLSYDTDFCGVARPWNASACDPPDVGTISVSVNTTRVATITGTGEPAGTGYTITWGAGTPDTGVALDGQTNTYAADGTYTVNVVNETVGYQATVDIAVTNGVASGPFVATAEATKLPDDGIGETTGNVITVYHRSTCRLVGSGADRDRRQRAERAITLGASRALEEGFGDVIAAEVTADSTDLTPSGTAVKALRGLAILEQYGGEVYGGQRFIHADNATVTALASQGLVLQKGGHLETILGSIVIAGPGYAASTPPSAPAANARWMYATGMVNIWEQKIKVTETILNSDPYDNEYSVLAERMYVPTYECFAAAVEILVEV